MTTTINGSSPSITFSDSTTQSTAGLPLTGGTLTGSIVVPTLNAPSGVLATQNGMTGICKAWVNFNGTSGSIYKGFNVSSVTRTAAGFYTVNFTTAMPDANYAVVLGSIFGTNGTTVTSPSIQTYGGAPAQTTTALYVSNQGTGGGGGNADSQQFCVAVFD